MTNLSDICLTLRVHSDLRSVGGYRRLTFSRAVNSSKGLLVLFHQC